MSLTSTLAKIPTSASDNNVDTYVIDKSKFVLASSDASPDRSVQTATYVLADGDPLTEVSIVVRIQLDKGKTNPLARYSIRLITTELIADSVTGRTEKRGPVEAGVFYNLPLLNTVSVSDVMKLLSAAEGLLHGTITTGVPADTYVSKLSFNVPAIF